MNVTKPEKEKTSISAIIIYTVSILACIIAVIIVICTGFFENDNLGNTSTDTSQEIDTQILKVEFNNIFDNKLDIKNTNIEVKKLKNEKDIVFTDYQRKETKENNYDLDLNIPKINVDTDTIKKYNQEISDTFIKKAENILASSNSNSIYTVQYAATIEDDILSLVPSVANFNITNSIGWPYDTKGITLDRWYGVPVTLESNVEKLHREEFDDPDYEAPETVEVISNRIINKTGYTD